MPHVRAVDAEQPVVGADPAVQGRDRVLKDFHDEDAGLGAAAADPDAEMLPRLKTMMIIMPTHRITMHPPHPTKNPL